MMGNEMGNNSTSGLRDEENNAVDEVGKNSLVETTQENEIAPTADQGKYFQEKVTNLASDDPQRTEDPSVDYQNKTDQEEIQVLPVAEVSEKSSKETTHENDLKEPNETSFAAEGIYFDEKVANLASDDPERIEDLFIDRREEEATEVDAAAESLEAALETNEAGEGEDGTIESAALLNDSGHEKPLEQKMEETDLQGTIKHQLEKQASFKKDDPEPKESAHLELNQQELAAIDAAESYTDGSQSVQGSEDSLGSNLRADFEVNGHISETEALKNAGEILDSKNYPVSEKKRADLLEEKKATQEQLESSEEKFEAKDGDKVDNELSNIREIASNGLSDLGNESDGEFPTDMSLESEAIVQVHEPENKCIILKEEIRPIENNPENGENNHDDIDIPIQSCGLSAKGSESFKSNEPQFGSAMVSENGTETSEDSEGNVELHCNNKEEEEATGKKENENNNDSALNMNQESSGEFLEMKASEDTEGNVERHCNNKEEEEATEKKENEDNNDSALNMNQESHGEFLAMQASEDLEGKFGLHCNKKEEGAMEKKENGDNDDSALNLNQESRSEFLATQASTIDCTNWIVEALASMNKLALDMPGQNCQVPLKAAETKISGNQCAQFETCASVSCGSETQESWGRSSTESDADNLSNVRSRIQKSPSFSLDLKNEARAEESDCTPLLYDDKAAIEGSRNQGDDVILGNLLVESTGHEQEEKVIRLERSDTEEESKTPFIGFLKEEEEAHIVGVAQSNHGNYNNSTKIEGAPPTSSPSSSKGKENSKRRQRSSLFTDCMCCATVIN